MEAKFPKRMQHSPSEWLESFVTCGVCNVAIQVRQERHGARATDSRSYEGNRSERMIRLGGEVTVLLDLVLLRLVCCCIYFRGCDGAKVSTQVESQTNNLPFDPGTMVIPSGRLPSAQPRPVGSSREGTLAEDKALCRMSLSMAWQLWMKLCKPI